MSNTFMTASKLMFTSESVTEGHPDKLCDQISDAVLDACLEQDPRSRVACETATKTGFVALLGEITTNAVFNYDQLARQVICDIGYDDSAKGFDGNSCGVLVAIAKQSGDIAMGVDHAYETRDGHHLTDEDFLRRRSELAPVGKELGDDAVVLDLAGAGAMRAEVDVLAVDRDVRLA